MARREELFPVDWNEVKQMPKYFAKSKGNQAASDNMPKKFSDDKIKNNQGVSSAERYTGPRKKFSKESYTDNPRKSSPKESYTDNTDGVVPRRPVSGR